MELNNRTLQIWNKAKNCNCSIQDCKENHKLCGICGQTIIFTAHVGNQSLGKYSWDINHVIPLYKGGTNNISNLQISHVRCNQKKANNKQVLVQIRVNEKLKLDIEDYCFENGISLSELTRNFWNNILKN